MKVLMGSMLAIPWLLVGSCTLESDTPSSDDTSLSLSSGCQTFLGEKEHSFPIGETVWLAALSDNCQASAWELSSKPTASQSEIKSDGSHFYIVPDELGNYTVRNKETDEVLSYEATGPKDFLNYNYYPLGSIDVTQDAIWVANVFHPSVSRLNPKTLERLENIPVGSWPVSVQASPKRNRVFVAQKASDTIGVIDTLSNTLVDSLWVGDEPAYMVKDKQENRLFISLQGEDAIAVVDLATLELIKKIPTVKAPSGMALSPDGSHLYVAAMRSGHPSRYPYENDEVENERDIDVIDIASGTVIQSFKNIGTTIKALLVSEDGKELFVANLTNDTSKPLGSPTSESFNYEIRVLDVDTGGTLRVVNLSPKSGLPKPYPALHQMVLRKDRLFVVSEATDSLIELNSKSLEIIKVRDTSGRPRSIALGTDGIYVHGHQDRMVEFFKFDGDQSFSNSIVVEENRPADLALGQKFFTGAGDRFAKSWACNSCHLDGLTDTLIWDAGPVKDTHVTRPLFWLEGTDWLGWQGYLSSVKNYAYVVTSNVGRRPNTEEALALGAYLSSLTPPPAANHLTKRDGTLSVEALIGKELFEGKAACSACHSGPLFTNRRVVGQSINPDKADTPSLVGSYRHQVWMKHGEALTLNEATKQMTAFFNIKLSDGEAQSITRYLNELTAREFFLLRSYPRSQVGMPSDDTVSSEFSKNLPWPVWKAPRLVFSHPILEDEENLKLISLRKVSTGEMISVDFETENQELWLNLEEPLDYNETYQITIANGFQSQLNTVSQSETVVEFRTPEPPKFKLGANYMITVDLPDLRAVNAGKNPLDPSIIRKIPVNFSVLEKGSGGEFIFDYGANLIFNAQGIVDGNKLYIEPVPVPAGPFSFADGFSGFQGELLDLDSDGVGDSASGVYTLAGPGFRIDGLAWTLKLVK